MSTTIRKITIVRFDGNVHEHNVPKQNSVYSTQIFGFSKKIDNNIEKRVGNGKEVFLTMSAPEDICSKIATAIEEIITSHINT